MKRQQNISRFFIAIYIVMLFGAYIPYVEYAVHYDYITKNLCENKDKPQSTCAGKCHLKKQISETIEKQIPDQDNNKATLSIHDFAPAILWYHAFNLWYKKINPFYSIKPQSIYKFTLYKSLFRPPPFLV